MKRVFSLVLALLFLLLSFPVSAATEGKNMANEAEIIQVVRMLGIMNGDQYGNLNLDKVVTRAEFIKMAVSTSSFKDSVITSTNLTSPFPDVRNTHWAAGYVTVGVAQSWITGYLDGSFRPDNTVKLEEAVNIALKLLGYSDTDFTGTYPDAQLAKYVSLEMNTGIQANKGDYLTRRDCMRLLYNTLNTKTKSGRIYCTTLDYSADTNSRIDYLSLLLSKTEGPYTILDSSYQNRLGFSLDDAIIYRDGVQASVPDLSVYDVFYYSDTLKTIWSYSDKAIGVVQDILPSRANPTSVKIAGVTYSLGNSNTIYQFSTLGKLKKDSFVMLLLGRDGTVADAYEANADLYNLYADDDSDTVSLLNSTVEGPVVVKDAAQLSTQINLDLSKALIYLDDKTISPEEIKANDVVYYSASFNKVWIYRDTATGICETVSPSVDSPTSVTIEGKVYTLENATVKYKFSAYGAYKKDDFITLLLGREGNAVDVIDGDASAVAKDDDNYFDILESTIEGPVIAGANTNWREEIPFDLTNAAFYKDSVQISSSDIKTNDVLYYSKAFQTVWVYRDTVTGVCDLISPGKEAPSSVTISGKSYPLDTTNVKYKFSTYGTFEKNNFVTLLLGRSGKAVDVIYGNANDSSAYDDENLSYSQIVESTIKGPVLVKDSTWKNNVDVNFATATIYKGDKQISASDVSTYNVVYYSTVLNSVWVYSDKKSGMLEAVTPNKASPTAVIISGTSYSLETSEAKYAVSSFGTYKLGDTVTILLGKDGGVANITSAQDINKPVYGIVTSLVGSKTYTNPDGTTYKSSAIKVTDTLGIEQEYAYASTSGFEKGDVVRITFDSSDKAVISVISTSMTSSKLATLRSAMDKNLYAENAGILDIYRTDDRNTLIYSKIYPSRLAGTSPTEDDVLYFTLNASGEIETLIFNDFTGDLCQYAYLLISNFTDSTGVSHDMYRYLLDGQWATLDATKAKSLALTTGAIGIFTVNGSVVDAYNLTGKLSLETLNSTYATSMGNTYNVSSDVAVYIRNGADYTRSSIAAVEDAGYTLVGYYDGSNSSGALIRVIIASK